MPVLSNPRHERFAQELAKGRSQVDAYELAGFKPDDAHAARLAGNGRISGRVAELLAAGAKRVEVTVESLIAEAEEARQGAMQDHQWSAAVAAVKEKGVLSGVRVEKSERKSINDVRRIHDNELDALIANLVAREESEKRGAGVAH